MQYWILHYNSTTRSFLCIYFILFIYAYISEKKNSVTVFLHKFYFKHVFNWILCKHQTGCNRTMIGHVEEKWARKIELLYEVCLFIDLISLYKHYVTYDIGITCYIVIYMIYRFDLASKTILTRKFCLMCKSKIINISQTHVKHIGWP